MFSTCRAGSLSCLTLTRALERISGRQEGICAGVSAISCHPALDVHSPVRSPLPTSNLASATTDARQMYLGTQVTFTLRYTSETQEQAANRPGNAPGVLQSVVTLWPVACACTLRGWRMHACKGDVHACTSRSRT